jgi:hypothetical protein
MLILEVTAHGTITGPHISMGYKNNPINGTRNVSYISKPDQTTSARQHSPFVNLFTTYQPLATFVPLYLLELNILKAAKSHKSDPSPE